LRSAGRKKNRSGGFDRSSEEDASGLGWTKTRQVLVSNCPARGHKGLSGLGFNPAGGTQAAWPHVVSNHDAIPRLQEPELDLFSVENDRAARRDVEGRGGAVHLQPQLAAHGIDLLDDGVRLKDRGVQVC
jgi:hypothetical protein